MRYLLYTFTGAAKKNVTSAVEIEPQFFTMTEPEYIPVPATETEWNIKWN